MLFSKDYSTQRSAVYDSMNSFLVELLCVLGLVTKRLICLPNYDSLNPVGSVPEGGGYSSLKNVCIRYKEMIFFKKNLIMHR